MYCVLHDLVAGREGPTRPVTHAQLAESCGVSVDTIDRRLTQLVAAGAVEKQAQITLPDEIATRSPLGLAWRRRQRTLDEFIDDGLAAA